MISSLEIVRDWAAETLGLDAGTYVPADATAAYPDAEPFCVVTRTGGTLDYPHDSPKFAVQVWAADESAAETYAAMLAIACRTMPPKDPHINSVAAPAVLSYGREDGGWFVWETDIDLEINLLP